MDLVVAAVLVIGLLVWMITRLNKSVRGSIEADLLAFAGVTGAASHFKHFEGETAVVLNRTDRTIALQVIGARAKYGYGEIREWTINQQDLGRAFGFGVQGQMAAAGANIAAIRKEVANTGLSVRVRDINHPEWFIRMWDKTTRNRWFEILTQEINEGGIQTAPRASGTSGAGFCGNCGTARQSHETRFCAGCGSPMGPQSF